MSLRYKGGVISATPPTTTGGTSGTAKGVWTLEQQLQAQAAGNWPVAPPQAVQVSRSLRFNSADSAYLNRTLSSGNRKTWTWSGWVKLSSNKNQTLFSCVAAQNDTQALFIDMLSGGNLRVLGWTTVFRSTSAVYRDFSAWYHIVVAFDTTQATANDRIKIYVNGSQVTSFGTTNNPTQNTDYGINQAASHEIGRYVASSVGYDYFDGYMTNIDFIDGQALTPSSFGQTNSTTGVWEPIQTVGYLTYGTNGFHVDFADNSGTTSTTLGKDTSGNSNNWTPNNFSVTAGTGNDSLVDSPTPYGTDTGVGGEVRGNYSTWNPLRNAATLANGNLDISSSSSGVNSFATIGLTSGKWYWEVTATAIANTYYPGIGVDTDLTLAPTSQAGGDAVGYMYLANGQKFNNNAASSYGNSYTTNDVIGVALDMDAGKIWFSKNGTFQNSGSPTGGTNAAFTGITGTAVPVVISWTGSTCSTNFGQRPFAYTAPSGFKALVTQNLPTPATVQPDDYFNTVLYTGTGSSQSITGVGFQPDFVWVKGRSGATDHALYDAVRGVQKQIESNTSTAETTETTGLTAFGTDGFTVGALAQLNTSTATYVSWNWKANGAGSSNTEGTITSTVSVSTTAGISIVTYTGNGSSGATIGHGLGATPGMVIVKRRNLSEDWFVSHISASSPAGSYLKLNATNAVTSNLSVFNNTNPTSTVFTVGNDNGTNANGSTYVAYCFAPIVGFSAFGSYTGNGSTDGPFVYTGFRPRYLMIKRTDTANNWVIQDTSRDPYNVSEKDLYADTSGAEATYAAEKTDILSNGFKQRQTGTSMNANGGTYIYAAFAESPFKYSLGR